MAQEQRMTNAELRECLTSIGAKLDFLVDIVQQVNINTQTLEHKMENLDKKLSSLDKDMSRQLEFVQEQNGHLQARISRLGGQSGPSGNTGSMLFKVKKPRIDEKTGHTYIGSSDSAKN